MSSVQTPPPSSGAANSGRADQSGANNRTQEREAERSQDDFSKALDKKKSSEKGDKLPAGEKKDGIEDLFRQAHGKKKEGREEGDQGQAFGEAARSMNAQASGKAEVQAVDNKQMIDRIEKIADRIMVAEAGDMKAVKIDFKDGVLPGTEVMIRKDGAGKLQIEFTTTSADSFNFLNKGEQGLMDTLNRKIGGDVSVNIKMQGGGTDADSGDGRSREQYFAEDDNDDSQGA